MFIDTTCTSSQESRQSKPLIPPPLPCIFSFLFSSKHFPQHHPSKSMQAGSMAQRTFISTIDFPREKYMLQEGHSGISTLKYKFSFDRCSQATLSLVSSFDPQIRLYFISHPSLVVGSMLMPSRKLGSVDWGVCERNLQSKQPLEPDLRKMSSWVGNPGRPPYVSRMK